MNVMAPVELMASGDLPPFKLRIEDYELLDRAGAFYGHRVQLIGGKLVVVNAQLQGHIVVKNRLSRRFQHALEGLNSPLEALVEATLALSPHDLPDPDILLAATTQARDYIQVGQAALVVEVADTSIRHDLGEKRDLYSRNAVPEYWVVDMNTRQVHQFWSIAEGSYAESRVVPLAGPLASLTMPDLVIDGSGIL